MHKNETVMTEEVYFDNHIVDRLAQALVFNLNIPDGIHLVSSLGNGDEENNMEAVKTWIKKQKLDNDDLKSAETLFILEEKLSNALRELKTRHMMFS